MQFSGVKNPAGATKESSIKGGSEWQQPVDSIDPRIQEVNNRIDQIKGLFKKADDELFVRAREKHGSPTDVTNVHQAQVDGDRKGKLRTKLYREKFIRSALLQLLHDSIMEAEICRLIPSTAENPEFRVPLEKFVDALSPQTNEFLKTLTEANELKGIGLTKKMIVCLGDQYISVRQEQRLRSKKKELENNVLQRELQYLIGVLPPQSGKLPRVQEEMFLSLDVRFDCLLKSLPYAKIQIVLSLIQALSMLRKCKEGIKSFDSSMERFFENLAGLSDIPEGALDDIKVRQKELDENFLSGISAVEGFIRASLLQALDPSLVGLVKFRGCYGGQLDRDVFELIKKIDNDAAKLHIVYAGLCFGMFASEQKNRDEEIAKLHRECEAFGFDMSVSEQKNKDEEVEDKLLSLKLEKSKDADLESKSLPHWDQLRFRREHPNLPELEKAIKSILLNVKSLRAKVEAVFSKEIQTEVEALRELEVMTSNNIEILRKKADPSQKEQTDALGLMATWCNKIIGQIIRKSYYLDESGSWLKKMGKAYVLAMVDEYKEKLLDVAIEFNKEVSDFSVKAERDLDEFSKEMQQTLSGLSGHIQSLGVVSPEMVIVGVHRCEGFLSRFHQRVKERLARNPQNELPEVAKLLDILHAVNTKLTKYEEIVDQYNAGNSTSSPIGGPIPAGNIFLQHIDKLPKLMEAAVDKFIFVRIEDLFDIKFAQTDKYKTLLESLVALRSNLSIIEIFAKKLPSPTPRTELPSIKSVVDGEKPVHLNSREKAGALINKYRARENSNNFGIAEQIPTGSNSVAVEQSAKLVSTRQVELKSFVSEPEVVVGASEINSGRPLSDISKLLQDNTVSMAIKQREMSFSPIPAAKSPSAGFIVSDYDVGKSYSSSVTAEQMLMDSNSGAVEKPVGLITRRQATLKLDIPRPEVVAGASKINSGSSSSAISKLLQDNTVSMAIKQREMSFTPISATKSASIGFIVSNYEADKVYSSSVTPEQISMGSNSGAVEQSAKLVSTRKVECKPFIPKPDVVAGASERGVGNPLPDTNKAFFSELKIRLERRIAFEEKIEGAKKLGVVSHEPLAVSREESRDDGPSVVVSGASAIATHIRGKANQAR